MVLLRSELEAAIAEGLTQAQLAERFGIREGGHICYWLNKYELKTLTEARRRAPHWSKYTEETLREAVAASTSVMGVVRYLGLAQAGGTHQHLSRRIKKLGIDTSHFLGVAASKGTKSPWKKAAAEILILRESGGRADKVQLRRALAESGVEEICALCGTGTVWNGLPLRLQIDHIDGNWLNDRLSNLRYLCPNCHTQQGTSKSHRERRFEQVAAA